MSTSVTMDLFDAVVQYEIALWNTVDDALYRRGQVRLGLLHALRVLRRHDGQARVQELSADIQITVGAASKLVDRLERDGLAERSPNPANRRSSLIGLTPLGVQSLEAALNTAQTATDQVLQGEDVETITGTLRRLLTRLEGTGREVAA